MDTKHSLAALIAETIEECYMGIDGLPTADEIAGFLEIPPQKEMGDYAFPCFKLSKVLRKGPPMIASTLAGAIGENDLARAEQMGGYLNFFLVYAHPDQRMPQYPKRAQKHRAAGKPARTGRV